MTDQPEAQLPEPSNSVANVSGGVTANAEEINVGGDVVGRDKIVTITYNYFTGDFATLDDLYIPPDAIFQRVHIQDFIGREWLIAKVDNFLNDPKRKSGALLLVGEAGVGKTSFLAHLVAERHYLHLFAEQVPGDANLSRALQSLGAQLVARYQIDPYKKKDTLPAIATFPDFLDRLLRLAAGKLSAGNKIVIVCDALDEAGTAPNGNVFGLPSVLPDGVYFILSQRPVPIRLTIKIGLQTERIDAVGADNLLDMERYLKTVAYRSEISEQLRAHGYSETDFVRTLTEKSGGVWMYLYYVVSEIMSGNRAPLDLAKLPSGLAAYYTEYWGDWAEGRNERSEGPTKWDMVYAPLLTTLAAAQEPISLDMLIIWSGVSASSYEVERLLRKSWRAFIAEREADGRSLLYRLYHASLRDFLIGNVDHSQLNPESEILVDELTRRTHDAHACIVDFYRQRCAGNWARLIDDAYLRNHLSIHLMESDQHKILFELVAMSNTWAEAKYAREESYAGYLIDLDLVWRGSDSEEHWNVGHQVRCALIESSVHSLAGNLSPELLTHLVETGIWSIGRSLEHVLQISSASQQAEAIQKLAPYLPDELKHEALMAARAIKDKIWQVRALISLASVLPEETKSKELSGALRIMRDIEDADNRAALLGEMASILPDQLQSEALEIARATEDGGAYIWGLTALASTLPDETKVEVITEVFEAAQDLFDENNFAQVLRELAGVMPDTLRAEALEMAFAIKEDGACAKALCALAKALPDDSRIQVVHEAVLMARDVASDTKRAGLLIELAEISPANLKIEALNAALDIRDTLLRVQTLCALAKVLPRDLRTEVVNEALFAARSIRDGNERTKAIGRIVEVLPDHLKAKVVTEVLIGADGIADHAQRADLLIDLAGVSPDTMKTEVVGKALSAARKIERMATRTRKLCSLIRLLPEDLKIGATHEALAAARVIEDEDTCVAQLSELARVLPDELKTSTLAAARRIRRDDLRADVLVKLVDALTDSQKVECLTIARAIQANEARAKSLIELARTLPDPLKAVVSSEALQAVREIPYPMGRVFWLGELAKVVSDELRIVIARDAMAAVWETTDELMRESALRLLIEFLPKELMAEALKVATSLPDEYVRAGALSGLAEVLPDTLKATALATIRGIRSDGARASALTSLVWVLPSDMKAQIMDEVWIAAQSVKLDSDRARLFAELTRVVPEELKEAAAREAITSARGITSDSIRAGILSEIAAMLPLGLKNQALDEALTAARSITEEVVRIRASIELVEVLPGKLKAEVWHETLAMACQLIDVVRRRDVLPRVTAIWRREFGKPANYHAFWSGLLHSLTNQARGDLLGDLAALEPLIENWEGSATLVEIAYAVWDVAQWWP